MKLNKTCREQSMEGLIGYGTATPHLPGMSEISPGWMPWTPEADRMRQLQVARRSSLLLAAAFIDRTPLQQPRVRGCRPWTYPRQGNRYDTTWLQLICASTAMAHTRMATATWATTGRRAIDAINSLQWRYCNCGQGNDSIFIGT